MKTVTLKCTQQIDENGQLQEISKRQWYDLGGFARTGLFRKADCRGVWRYYIDHYIFS